MDEDALLAQALVSWCAQALAHHIRLFGPMSALLQSSPTPSSCIYLEAHESQLFGVSRTLRHP
jgi:hypothetical protein